MLNNLTGLRFFAAFWVFLFHAEYQFKEFSFLFFQKGYLGVDFFFILSGFILTYVYYDTFFRKEFDKTTMKKFLVKRLAKIYPSHLLTFIIIAFLLFTSKYLLHQDSIKIHPETILPNLMLIHAWNVCEHISFNFPSWSISAEWFAYLALFPVLSFIYFRNKTLFLILCSILFLGLVFFGLSQNDFNLDHYTTNSFPRIIPMFAIGCVLGAFRKNKNLNKKAATLLGVTGIFGIAVLFSTFSGNIIDASIGLCFCLIVLGFSYPTYLDFIFGHKKLIYLGNTSFAFYLTQLLALILIEQFMKRTGVNAWIGFSILCIGNFLFAHILYTYFEEPVRKYLVKKYT